MNLAHPQPTPLVTRLEGFLSTTRVTFDSAVIKPVNSKVQYVLSPEDLPLIDQLITEDDKPVDNVPSSKQQRLLVDPLYDAWKGRMFLADVNVGLFHAVRESPLVPDMFLSLEVPVPKDWWLQPHRSYFCWEFGKPPEIVVEIVTDQEGGEDSGKLLDYAKLGICYYVIFDPTQQLSETILRTYELRGDRYEQMNKPWFPELNLGLKLWTGEYENLELLWLRWCDKEGNLILTGLESCQPGRYKKEKVLSQLEQKRQQ